MFGLTDIPRLLMSALIILPLVMFIREAGYYSVATLLGATNKKLTIGCGPILFTLPTLEVRKYFFMYSWMDYDELNPDSKFWHGLIYASPILSSSIAATIINALIANGMIPSNVFWDVFLFYVFFYVLFDVLPVYLPDGQPTNGRAVFDLVWHGERSDFLKQKVQEEVSKMKETYSHAQSKDSSEGEGSSTPSEEASTKAQEETIENRDRDQREHGDHTDPQNNG
ncbi:hypothetical protein HNR44_002286 [Geomicrobium halophilum]|uniref:Uncharacterized protein n=1 Tax=Geomicrobium halophilum TaxID=549000 RepID=A0A841PZE6_9BACL|nr:hypothetical protein [Geomicrobium halophilum]MBB6450303.1 hypothetical protein [Geomicrobium halophilum]